jgi:hypothetical protein
MSAMSEPQKEVLSKLKNGKRLTKEDYVLLRQLKKEGKLSQTQQSLLSARQRLNKSKRIKKTADSRRQVRAGQATAADASDPPNPQPPVVAPPKVDVAGKYEVSRYSDDVLKPMLTKSGTMPKDFQAFPDALQQLRKTYKTPALTLTKDGNLTDQMEEFARAISEVAKKSPLSDQENVCLFLSHKVVQANRPIENFGSSIYNRAVAMLQSGGEIKKKVSP